MLAFTGAAAALGYLYGQSTRKSDTAVNRLVSSTVDSAVQDRADQAAADQKVAVKGAVRDARQKQRVGDDRRWRKKMRKAVDKADAAGYTRGQSAGYSAGSSAGYSSGHSQGVDEGEEQ